MLERAANHLFLETVLLEVQLQSAPAVQGLVERRRDRSGGRLVVRQDELAVRAAADVDLEEVGTGAGPARISVVRADQHM